MNASPEQTNLLLSQVLTELTKLLVETREINQKLSPPQFQNSWGKRPDFVPLGKDVFSNTQVAESSEIVRKADHVIIRDVDKPYRHFLAAFSNEFRTSPDNKMVQRCAQVAADAFGSYSEFEYDDDEV